MKKIIGLLTCFLINGRTSASDAIDAYTIDYYDEKITSVNKNLVGDIKIREDLLLVQKRLLEFEGGDSGNRDEMYKKLLMENLKVKLKEKHKVKIKEEDLEKLIDEVGKFAPGQPCIGC